VFTFVSVLNSFFLSLRAVVGLCGVFCVWFLFPEELNPRQRAEVGTRERSGGRGGVEVGTKSVEDAGRASARGAVGG